MDPFLQITSILALAVVLGGIGVFLKQPLIVTFIGVGVLCGPAVLGLVEGGEILDLLAEMGIVLLLFVVGLKLDIQMIRTMGPVALATGMGQVLFTSLVGFLIILALGFDWLPAIYIAVALTFSSTIIIVKLLTDKREIDSLHGRIAIGFLIVQDILVVVALILLSSFRGMEGSDRPMALELARVGISGALFLAGVFALMRWVLPWLLEKIAFNQELLVLFSVAWAVALAQVGAMLGFSHEVGAFLAGMSLAGTPFRETIGNRLTSLRDFLLLFFFIKLGSSLDLGLLGAQVVPAIILSLFVLIGNPIIVLIIMGVMGYRKRTGFLAGLTVAQISEFSLVLAALGVSVGHLTPEGLGLVTLVGLITIAVSTYMILYSFPLYRKLSPLLSIFERKIPFAEKDGEDAAQSDDYDVVIFGSGRFGTSLAERLLARQRKLLIVDFDPSIVDKWRSRGVTALYGDVDDPDLLEHVPLERTGWVVISMPFRIQTATFIKTLRRFGYKGKIAATIGHPGQGDICRKAGADLLFRPFSDAAEQAVDALTNTADEFNRDSPWPVGIREVRVPSGSILSGKRLRDITLRRDTGSTIVAVSRAGRSVFDLSADFQIFTGDRIVLVGDDTSLEKAREYVLQRFQDVVSRDAADESGLAMNDLSLADHPEWAGKTIAELNLRHQYGVTVVSVKRGESYINAPRPDFVLEADDALFILGQKTNVELLCRKREEAASLESE
jgi:Kef-type K+ transport system membrane component KefB/Trk K+ transport system NAD-binding subunit